MDDPFSPKLEHESTELHNGEGLEFQLSEQVVEIESNLVFKQLGNRGLQYLYSFRNRWSVSFILYAHTWHICTRNRLEDLKNRRQFVWLLF